MTAVTTRRRIAPPSVLVLIGVAWALAVAGSVSGAGQVVHHQQIIEGGPPLWAALALFVAAWQVHVAAMMLPSSLPLVALFDRVVAGQPGARGTRTAFLIGYMGLWTVFGALALAIDVPLHHAVDHWPWLSRRPWLIGGSVLVLTGLFQFSALKDRCLRECRHPGAFIVRHYRRGPGAAFSACGTAHSVSAAAGHSCWCCLPWVSRAWCGWRRSR